MLFSMFPREVGPPRKLVYNLHEYLLYVNMHNGKKKAIYTSIYMFDNILSNPYVKPDYDSVVVDKIYFDFDDKSCNAWQECMKLHKELEKQGLKHCIVMSGRGYHLYIFCKVCNLQYKKEAIRGAQSYFIDLLDLTVDSQVVGNVAQLARIPNTYHPKAKRFCIPLTKEQFKRSDHYIKDLAKKQNFVEKIVMGRKLFDISKFDINPEMKFDLELPIIDSKRDMKLEEFSPLITRLLGKKNAGWHDRYLIILYLKERGFTMKEVYSILKNHLSEKKLYHCVKEEKQLQYLFSREDLIFPSFERLYEKGDCKSKEEYGKDIYK